MSGFHASVRIQPLAEQSPALAQGADQLSRFDLIHIHSPLAPIIWVSAPRRKKRTVDKPKSPRLLCRRGQFMFSDQGVQPPIRLIRSTTAAPAGGSVAGLLLVAV